MVNPGGTIAPCVGYVAGRKVWVEVAAARLSAPGLGVECRSTPGDLMRTLFQGIFLAPQMVGEAIKGSLLVAEVMASKGYKVQPLPRHSRHASAVKEMASEVPVNGASLFTEEELKDIPALKIGNDFVEVACGCTSRRHGDAVGSLRVFRTGNLEIKCECITGCTQDIMTPAQFEKHTREEWLPRRWKHNIWVLIRGKKVHLEKSVLFRYYREAEENSGRGKRGRKPFHRDEFINCTKCNKLRRFELRNTEQCRSYHDALANPNWECSDYSRRDLSCQDLEERSVQKSLRSCPRNPQCKGCTDCVCFGCTACRFSDCNCRTCVDFTANADI